MTTVPPPPPPLVVGPLVRTDFVRYQGASGDMNPLHHDETFARKAGYDAPLAVGMFNAGLLATYATDWLLNGGSIKVLADLIGTSVSMIERHYGHIMVDKDRVRSIMTSVMKDRGSGTAAGTREGA